MSSISHLEQASSQQLSLNEARHVQPISIVQDAQERLQIEGRIRVLRAVTMRQVTGLRSTALKVKACETAIVDFLVDASAASAEARRTITIILSDNLAGIGHLSRPRAKQALKRIGRTVKPAILIQELCCTPDCMTAFAAEQLLGFSKRDGVIIPMMETYIERPEMQDTIQRILLSHYRGKIERYINRYFPANAQLLKSGLLETHELKPINSSPSDLWAMRN